MIQVTRPTTRRWLAACRAYAAGRAHAVANVRAVSETWSETPAICHTSGSPVTISRSAGARSPSMWERVWPITRRTGRPNVEDLLAVRPIAVDHRASAVVRDPGQEFGSAFETIGRQARVNHHAVSIDEGVTPLEQ